jgi:tetratricopeptide (TPR) repeat protein
MDVSLFGSELLAISLLFASVIAWLFVRSVRSASASVTPLSPLPAVPLVPTTAAAAAAAVALDSTVNSIASSSSASSFAVPSSQSSRAPFQRRLKAMLDTPIETQQLLSLSSSLGRSFNADDDSDELNSLNRSTASLDSAPVPSSSATNSKHSFDAYAYFEDSPVASVAARAPAVDELLAARGLDGGYGYVEASDAPKDAPHSELSGSSSGYVEDIQLTHRRPGTGYDEIERPPRPDRLNRNGYELDAYDEDDGDDDDNGDNRSSSSSSSSSLAQHAMAGPREAVPITTFVPASVPPTPKAATWSSSVPASAQPAASSFRQGVVFQGDWNERFQKIWDEINSFHANTPQSERMYQHLQLLHLAQDFLYSCVTYGRIILSELALPDAAKTIRPAGELGGVAGGTKYVAQSIMFKLAIDKDGFFGGANDYAAAKVAGHELHGLQAYMTAGIKDLHFPLMALVDYRGFRLIAMSILPIDRTTIVYGSADAGTTVHAKDAVFNRRMMQAARALNLKPHVVGRFADNGRVLASAGDLEGHVGHRDKRFYLCDFSRAMPPETPVHGVPLGHLYRLLRPEFVRRFRVPLCSDGFSAFIRAHNPLEHCRELREATHELLNAVIPRFAAKLVALVAQHKAQNGGVLAAFSITNCIHAEGINVRHLGALRSHVADTDTRAALLVEMCARVVKCDINFRLRERMKQTKVPLEQPYRRDVIEYLNTVVASNDASLDFWNRKLRPDLARKFGAAALSPEEQRGDFKWYVSHFRDWRNDGLLILLERIVELTGIKLRLAELSSAPNAWMARGDEPLDETDLIEFGVRVKFGSLVERAEAMFFKSKALLTTNSDLTKAVRFFRLALERFTDALRTDPDNADLLCQAAETHLKLYELTGRQARNLAYATYDVNDPRIAHVKTLYERAIDSPQSDASSFCQFAMFLERLGPSWHDAAEEYYLRSLEREPTLVALQEFAAFISERRGDVKAADRLMERYAALAKRLEVHMHHQAPPQTDDDASAPSKSKTAALPRLVKR